MLEYNDNQRSHKFYHMRVYITLSGGVQDDISFDLSRYPDATMTGAQTRSNGALPRHQKQVAMQSDRIFLAFNDPNNFILVNYVISSRTYTILTSKTLVTYTDSNLVTTPYETSTWSHVGNLPSRPCVICSLHLSEDNRLILYGIYETIDTQNCMLSAPFPYHKNIIECIKLGREWSCSHD